MKFTRYWMDQFRSIKSASWPISAQSDIKHIGIQYLGGHNLITFLLFMTPPEDKYRDSEPQWWDPPCCIHHQHTCSHVVLAVISHKTIILSQLLGGPVNHEQLTHDFMWSRRGSDGGKLTGVEIRHPLPQDIDVNRRKVIKFKLLPPYEVHQVINRLI